MLSPLFCQKSTFCTNHCTSLNHTRQAKIFSSHIFVNAHCTQIFGHQMFLYFSVNHDLTIVGSSIVHWAARRAGDTHARWRLLTATTTHWHGRRGMVWSQLSAACETLARADKHPRWLIIHLGGNDLASTPLKNLISMVQKDIKYIHFYNNNQFFKLHQEAKPSLAYLLPTNVCV